MARGGKSKGSKRGGSSRFAAQTAEEIEERNRRLEEFDAKRHQRRAEAGCSDAEESDGDNENNDSEDEAEKVGQRVKFMAIEKESKEGEEQEAAPMSRREREEAEKKAKAEAYRKRHEAGLTEEYRRDMAKLAEVKARREAAAEKARMEKEAQEAAEKDQREKAIKLGALDDSGDEGKKKSSTSKKKSIKSGPPKLDKITMKKMKPAQLKEALKERGLEIHGNAKELLKRLSDYEATR